MLIPRLRASLGVLAGGTFSSLALADHRRMFFGNMAFQFTVWMQQLMFGWLLLVIGNSPFWLGMGGFCYGIVMMTMGPIGGGIADAWERRRAMFWTQMTAVTVNAAVALLYWLGWLQIWHLLLASAGMGFAFALNMPARQSLMAELVPRPLLESATALHTASMNLSRITGPALAGVLMSMIGPLPVLLLNLTANSWTVRQLTQIRYRPARAPKAFRFDGSELLEGFRYCWRERRLFQTFSVLAVANLFGLSYVYLLPSLARDSLGAGPEGLGLLTSSMGGGALLGSLMLARRAQVERKGLWLSVTACVLGLLLFGLGRVDQLGLAAVALMLLGATHSLITALSISAVQELVPDELSGRVFGIYMLTMGLMPLGSLPGGALAEWVGTGVAISMMGVACAAVSLVLLAGQQATGRRWKSRSAALNQS